MEKELKKRNFVLTPELLESANDLAQRAFAVAKTPEQQATIQEWCKRLLAVAVEAERRAPGPSSKGKQRVRSGRTQAVLGQGSLEAPVAAPPAGGNGAGPSTSRGAQPPIHSTSGQAAALRDLPPVAPRNPGVIKGQLVVDSPNARPKKKGRQGGGKEIS
jgi:hypothetical protein